MRTEARGFGRLALLVAALGLALAAAAPAATPGGDVVVLLDRALDGSGLPLPATRLDVVGGRIVAGRAPESAPVLDARGFVVVPGFVDLRSGAGLDDPNEEASETTPGLWALDLVDPGDPAFAAALEGGVTTVVVAPGGHAVIGGQAAALKTDARRLDERYIGRAALVITLGEEPALGNRLARFQTPYGLHFRRPGNRMGVIAEIRRAFTAAREKKEGWDEPGSRSEHLDLVLAGRLPVWWRAHDEQDIHTAVRLSKELGLPPPVLLEPVEAHRAPELVAASCAAAVLGPAYEIPRNLMEAWEGEDFREATPKILHDAGAVVAIATGPEDPSGSLRDRAALAVRSGLPKEAALAAITSVPAKLVGAGDRLGGLSAGHDADLVVLDGEPFAPTTRVLAVIVEGRLAWRSKDAPTRLTPSLASAPPLPKVSP